MNVLLVVFVLFLAAVVASSSLAGAFVLWTLAKKDKKPYEVELVIADDEWSEDDEEHWRDFTTRERIMMDSDWE
jgi:hypothetical protein